MADAAVEFLLENLKQLVVHHGHLIANVQGEVDELQKDLCYIREFLKEITKRRKKDGRLKVLVGDIREVIYDAEDAIDIYITKAAMNKSPGPLNKLFKKPADLHKIALKVRDVRSKVQDICGGKSRMDFAQDKISEDGPVEEHEAPIIREKNVVGFEDEEQKLIKYLTAEMDELDVISIIGMPGLGKTTLAGMIFRNTEIQYQFPTRIWVYISQELTRRNVFLTILKEFTDISDEINRLSDQDLAKEVAHHLQTGKFLIVMDDLWTTDDWDKLKIALPMSYKLGKVLITSRHWDVGRWANPNREPHRLRFLTQEESWKLLQLEVFGKPECPRELEVYGRLIVDKCHNLPLAIVVIGGIIFKKYSTTKNEGVRISMWRKISENVSEHIDAEDPTKRMEKIIALSYDKLPYHLRACFLYFGMFPEDSEIPATKLTRMWIAEGFIQQRKGFSVEEIAESYLDDLINRNLLSMGKRKRDGKVKTCRIHDMLRDFCRNEAKNENFFQEMRKNIEENFDPPLTTLNKFRRLCIHSNVLDFVSHKPQGHGIRSFVCFADEDITLPSANISAIPTSFPLLRVLQAERIIFSKIPSDMYRLVHLSYIAISGNLPSLPQAFSKLWNIQTLIVNTTERTLEVKADIWKMVRLRHLKTKASTTLLMTNKSDKESAHIQTIGRVSPISCTEGFFNRIPVVKKLGIRGRLATFIDTKKGEFYSMGKLEKLEELKLMNDVHPSPSSEGRLRNLPPPNQFPPQLRYLTLAATYLDWTHMSILGQLGNLEVLKLKDKAFIGRYWETAAGGFRKLEALYIARTDLVVWIAFKDNFPQLRSLELSNCEYLQQVPIALADIESFQVLDLHRTFAATKSAKDIRDKKNMQKGKSTNYREFKLSIYPLDE